jgi:hypothetical protein
MWHHRNRWLLVALLAALTIWGFTDVRRRGYPYPQTPLEHKTDLTVYTEAGWAFFDGRKPYEVANPRGWTYLYPPMLALMLAPLHVLPMQDQVTVWFFLSLLMCWGCWRECRRVVEIVCDEDPIVAAAWARWSRWLVVAAVAVSLFPTLNCLQRGQVGILKLYLLMLGLRLILGGRTYRAWLAGGIVLALPVVLKILPLLQVGFLLFLLLIDLVQSYRNRPATLAPAGRRFAASSVGFAAGLVLFFLLVPAMLIGWRANLHHLDTWSQFVLTKADDGGMDPRSGNSHSSRNQSLHNAAYRLGNFGAHVLAGGPDDRLVEEWNAPPMAMDSPNAEGLLMACQAMMTLTLLAFGLRLSRGDGNRLNLAVGFALACAAMLVVSPVARGHYFLLLAPAVLLVPLWLDRRGRGRAGRVLAAIPPALSILHYALLPYAGRIGLLGMGTAAWLMAALVVMARAEQATRQTMDFPAVFPASTPLVGKAA